MPPVFEPGLLSRAVCMRVLLFLRFSYVPNRCLLLLCCGLKCESGLAFSLSLWVALNISSRFRSVTRNASAFASITGFSFFLLSCLLALCLWSLVYLGLSRYFAGLGALRGDYLASLDARAAPGLLLLGSWLFLKF